MRSISKKNFLKIFEVNGIGTLQHFPFGDAIALSPREGFIYANITGSVYLDNLVMPFTPKGLMKIFQSQEKMSFVTGLWSEGRPYFTPRNLVAKRNFLHEGVKYVFPIEFDSEHQFREQMASFFQYQEHPGQFIFQRIESSKEGGGLESVLEYFSCNYFRERGYLVDNQIPLAQKFGSPDWMAISTLDSRFEDLQGKGFYLFESSLPDSFGMQNHNSLTESSSVKGSIVGEAKVVQFDSSNQLSKYMRTGFFSKGILSFTDNYHPNSEYGITYFSDEWKFEYIPPANESEEYNSSSYERFLEFIITNLKIYMLSKYSNSDILEILSIHSFESISSKQDLLSAIDELSIADILCYG